MSEDRKTEPGPVLKAYEKAKEKVSDLAARGKDEAKSLMSGSAKDDAVTAGHDWKDKPAEEVSEADEVRSQEEMKETFDGDGVMLSDKRHKGQKGDGTDRNQQARTDLPDGSATAVMQGGADTDDQGTDEAPRRADEADLSGDVDDGGRRGQVEAQAPNVHAERAVGTDDNPAAPEMDALDGADLATRAEDEAGQVPSTGLGLDDAAADVTYPSDVRR